MAAAVNYNWGTSPDASVFGSAQPDGIASPTRLATSAPFARYLAEDLHEKCLFVQIAISQPITRLTNITGTQIEMPFFDIFGTPQKRWLSRMRPGATTARATTPPSASRLTRNMPGLLHPGVIAEHG